MDKRLIMHVCRIYVYIRLLMTENTSETAEKPEKDVDKTTTDGTSNVKKRRKKKKDKAEVGEKLDQPLKDTIQPTKKTHEQSFSFGNWFKYKVFVTRFLSN